MYIQWKHFHFRENEKTLVFPINYNWWRKQKELSEVKWMKSPWVQIGWLFYYREKHANINLSKIWFLVAWISPIWTMKGGTALSALKL